MKRFSVLGGALLAVVFISTANAGVTTFGAGAFAGMNIPVVQDDAESGSIFGIRGKLNLPVGISIQPYFATSSLGEYEVSTPLSTSKFDGGDLTILGVEGVLGANTVKAGLGVFLFAGFGSFKLKPGNDNLESESRVGYTGGIGLMIGLGQALAIEGRGTLAVVPQDGGGSRKYLLPNVGLSYTFGGGVK